MRYQLEVKDELKGKEGTQFLFAKVYPKERIQEEFRKRDRGWVSSPQLGKTRVFFPDLGMIVWVFPHDPVLRGIATAVAVLVVVRHRDNIKRIIAGTESRL
ncbi:MAG: hypothetical protein COA73_17810 [Candidatus Hydrogenedentota bacterium]|nr:MAG: hypothetical protein COA73_17810 [Candidatus Hydrogenedentota bacterium]